MASDDSIEPCRHGDIDSTLVSPTKASEDESFVTSKLGLFVPNNKKTMAEALRVMQGLFEHILGAFHKECMFFSFMHDDNSIKAVKSKFELVLMDNDYGLGLCWVILNHNEPIPSKVAEYPYRSCLSAAKRFAQLVLSEISDRLILSLQSGPEDSPWIPLVGLVPQDKEPATFMANLVKGDGDNLILAPWAEPPIPSKDKQKTDL